MEDADMTWRTSTYSSNGGGECVEVANTTDAVHVRDTTDRDARTLVFGADAWRALLDQIKS
jgi:Domain of unknown function (DUF397)